MNIYEKLEKIGFTKSEAIVFVEVLKNPGINGTQLSKITKLPRTSVYTALEELSKSSKIKLIPSSDDRKNYIPLDPKLFVYNTIKEYKEILDTIALDLEKIYNPSSFQEVYNIVGIDNIYYKANDIVTSSKDIIISNNVDIKKLNSLDDKNVKIIDNDNLIIIADKKEIIIADIDNIHSRGIYTKNTLIIENVLKGIL